MPTTFWQQINDCNEKKQINMTVTHVWRHDVNSKQGEVETGIITIFLKCSDHHRILWHEFAGN